MNKPQPQPRKRPVLSPDWLCPNPYEQGQTIKDADYYAWIQAQKQQLKQVTQYERMIENQKGSN